MAIAGEFYSSRVHIHTLGFSPSAHVVITDPIRLYLDSETKENARTRESKQIGGNDKTRREKRHNYTAKR